jgi:hypothetical protein
MIEGCTREGYLRGHADGMADKPLKDKEFKLSRASRLTLKSKLEQHVKTR